MAKQVIGIGTVANDGTGSPARTGAQLINANFDELYTLLGDGSVLDLEAAVQGVNLIEAQILAHSAALAEHTRDTMGVALVAGANITITPDDVNNTITIASSGSGSGDMVAATYDPQGIVGDAFNLANMTEAADAKIMTAAERTKLAGIEAAADVTDAANIEAAITGVTAEVLTDASVFPFVKTVTLFKITWANIKATLKTYFDTLYATAAQGALADTAVQNLGDLGVTANSAELNILDGVTASTAEINHLVGVTSPIQTQINALSVSGATATFSVARAPTGDDDSENTSGIGAVKEGDLFIDTSVVPNQLHICKFDGDGVAGTAEWYFIPIIEDTIASATFDPINDGVVIWDDSAGKVAEVPIAQIHPDEEIGIVVFESDEAVTTGDGTQGIPIPASMNGKVVKNVLAVVHTQGVTGTTDIQIRRRRAGSNVDVLSTKVTIGAEYFAADGVIDATNDDLATGDVLFTDIDAVHSGTAPNGLFIAITVGSP